MFCCDRCGYTTPRKANYIAHINKKRYVRL